MRLHSLIECPVLLWGWRRISTFIRQNHYGDSVTTPTRWVRKDTPLFNWPTILPASSQLGHSFINKCLILQVLHYQCPNETICHSVLHTNQEKGREWMREVGAPHWQKKESHTKLEGTTATEGSTEAEIFCPEVDTMCGGAPQWSQTTSFQVSGSSWGNAWSQSNASARK